MAKALSEAGMKATLPEGGWFMLTDFSSLTNKLGDALEEEEGTRDYKFVLYMLKKKRLMGIPPSEFYSEDHKHLAANYIRFCFMRKDETLDEGEKILKKM